ALRRPRSAGATWTTRVFCATLGSSHAPRGRGSTWGSAHARSGRRLRHAALARGDRSFETGADRDPVGLVRDLLARRPPPRRPELLSAHARSSLPGNALGSVAHVSVARVAVLPRDREAPRSRRTRARGMDARVPRDERRTLRNDPALPTSNLESAG